MKKLLLTLILILVAAGAQAQQRVSDVLLTNDGTLFTIASATRVEVEHDTGYSLDTPSTSVLRLSIQRDGETSTILVPASLNGGSHIAPTLAWDDSDKRLYIFWQRMPSIGATELLFASYKDGSWSEVEAFDGGSWRTRFNLQVTITRFVSTRMDDGTVQPRPVLIAHAIWWEQFGDHEAARYAMLELEQGSVRSVKIFDLATFITRDSGYYELPADYDRSIFRTPFLFEMPDSDSIEVLFANWYTNRYQLVNIRPISDEANGVLHIPIGVTRDEFEPAPIHVSDTQSALKAIRPNAASGSIIVYSHDGDTIDYCELRAGRWTKPAQLKLGSTTTLDTAIEALRRRAAQR
jgi:hypothetical protein